MKTPLHQRVLRTVRQYQMLPPGTRAAVAVSGGADSVALLHLLAELRSELGVSLQVIHFNHQLRGPDADADAAFVRALSDRLGLACHVEGADVAGIAQAEGWNLEDAARRLRHGFFARVVARQLVDRVAVAHTADDQAETVLMHLLRGAGLAGLAGIHPVAGIVLRPLLDARRADAREYLQTRGEPWREDASNQDTARLRARIRKQLLPLIEGDFQPAVVQRLASFAQLAREESAAWTVLLEDLLKNQVQSTGQGCRMQIAGIQHPFPLQPSSLAPVALQKKIIRSLLERARGHLRGITARHVEQVLALLNEAHGGTATHLPGLRVSRDLHRQLLVERAGDETPRTPSPYLYEVALPLAENRIQIRECGLALRIEPFDCAVQGRDTKNGAESLDGGLLIMPLRLRNWQPGDGYRPWGRARAHKLKRLFGEQRIPLQDRALWPVLLSGEAIVWARRFGVAAEFAVTERSRSGICITEDPS